MDTGARPRRLRGAGGSRTKKAAGRAITIIRTPRLRRAPRQPSACVRAWASEGHERAADADAQVGDAHGLAAARVEPAREQHLVGQGTAADVAEGVEQVEEVEGAERR